MLNFFFFFFFFFLFHSSATNLILNLFELMVDANIGDIALEPDRAVFKVTGGLIVWSATCPLYCCSCCCDLALHVYVSLSVCLSACLSACLSVCLSPVLPRASSASCLPSHSYSLAILLAVLAKADA